MLAFLGNLRGGPDRDAALNSYRRLHAGYDESCHWIEEVRALAIDLLGLRQGDVVLDVACGTGPLLGPLSRAVGARGRVIGIEQSPEMAAIASRRAAEAPHSNVSIIVAPVENARIDAPPADAVLFCYTHDVLQSDKAVHNIMRNTRPGARIVVAGARLVGWWGAPLNLWKLWRSRHYLSTYAGLRDPAARLRSYCPDLHICATRILGTSYVAVGQFPAIQ